MRRAPHTPLAPPHPAEGIYDIEGKGPKASLVTDVQRSPRLYSSMRSTAPRFRYKWGSQTYSDVDYNVDSGAKASITTALKSSPRVYGVMRSGTARISKPDTSLSHLGPAHTSTLIPERPDRPRSTSARIAPPPKQSAPPSSASGRHPSRRGKLRAKATATPAAEFHDADCGTNKSLATAVAQSPRSYAGMRSTVPRFAGAVVGGSGRDPKYQAALADIDFAGVEQLSRAMDTLQRRPAGQHGAAAVFTSSVPRFSGSTPMSRYEQDRGLKAALARQETPAADGGSKTTMATSILRSANKLSVMRSKSGRWNKWGRGTSAAPHLGPGTYRTEDHDRAISTRKRSITLPMNKVGRTTSKKVGAALVSNFSMERELGAWKGGRGGYISTTHRPPVARHVHTDQVYNTDTGHNKTLATAVATSPRKYAAIAPTGKSANAAQVDVSVYLSGDPRAARPATAPSNVVERRRKGLAARLAGDGYDAATVKKILATEDADYAIGAAPAKLYAGGAPGSGRMGQGSSPAARARKALPATIRVRTPAGRTAQRSPRVGRPPGHYYSDTSSSVRVKEPARSSSTLNSTVPRFQVPGDRALREALSTIEPRGVEHGSLGSSVATTARKYAVMSSTVPRSPE